MAARKENTITKDNVSDLLDYDPETGVFTWKRCLNSRARPGGKAGANCHGYIRIRYKGVQHAAHRLAFLIMTGNYPEKFIDHIDGNKSNNRWSNLREATAGQNQVYKPVDKSNTHGVKGVKLMPSGRWSSSIRVSRKKIHLGTFDSKEDAHQAYLKAVSEHFGEEFVYT